jgi:dual specificity tyrosine-phosphorylation-regulated kinase 2/3/4
MRHNQPDPVTPARDPAAIDRRGLVGVGELATPRWTRAPRVDDDDALFTRPEPLEEELEDLEVDAPDSPWTIEAVDGDGDGDEDYDHVGIFHIVLCFL